MDILSCQQAQNIIDSKAGDSESLGHIKQAAVYGINFIKGAENRNGKVNQDERGDEKVISTAHPII